MATENGFFSNQTQFQQDPNVSQRENLKGFYGTAVRPAYIEDLVAKAEEAAANSKTFSEQSKQYRDEAEVIRDETQVINDQTDQVYINTVQVYNDAVTDTTNIYNNTVGVYNDTVTVYNDTVSARDLALQYRDQALGHANSAASSASDAATSAANAEQAYQDTVDALAGVNAELARQATVEDIVDTRSALGLPLKPIDLVSKAAGYQFTDQDMPVNDWFSKLSVKGWNADYYAWEIGSGAGQTAGSPNNLKLWFRTGNDQTWNTWEEVYTSGNKPSASDVGAYTTAQVDALDAQNVKLTGDQSISGNKEFTQTLIASSIEEALGSGQGLLMFAGGSTRIGGSGSVAGIQLRPNGINVTSDTDYFSFQPGGLVEYEGTNNFGLSRAGGQHGTFAYSDGRTFLTGNNNNVEIRPKGLSDSSKSLAVIDTGAVVQKHSGGPAYKFRDAVASGVGSSSYFEWQHSDETRRGFIGFGSSANDNMTWFNDNGSSNIVLRDDGNVQLNAGTGDNIILSGTSISDKYQVTGAAGGSWGHSISPALKLTGTNSNLAYNLFQMGDTGAKIQALGEGGGTMRLYPEGGTTSYYSFTPSSMSMPPDSAIKFQGNYPNTGNVAPIFWDLDNPDDSGTSQIIRSMRETVASSWVWERLNSSTIEYTTGVNGNGPTQISMDTLNGRVGQLGAPTLSFHLTRKDYVDGVASDRNLKSEITPVENALSIVNSLPVYTYQKDVLEGNEETGEDEVVKQYEYGFIAQEVETVLPHLVLTGEYGMKNISRKGNDFHAIAFKAIQELTEENKQLKDRLAAIEAHLGLGE